MSNFRLVLRAGPTPGKVFSLDKDEMFIGREANNDITINDPEVSRRHARLYVQGGNMILEDLGSTNGTSVNGQRLTGPYVLRAGEIITLGEKITLLFEFAGRRRQRNHGFLPYLFSASISRSIAPAAAGISGSGAPTPGICTAAACTLPGAASSPGLLRPDPCQPTICTTGQEKYRGVDHRSSDRGVGARVRLRDDPLFRPDQLLVQPAGAKDHFLGLPVNFGS